MTRFPTDSGSCAYYYRIAFAVSILAFLLALLVLGVALWWGGQGGGGEGGYAALAHFVSGLYACAALALTSLAADLIAAIRLRGARWFLLLLAPLAACACWLAVSARVVPFAETVGPEDIPRLIESLGKNRGDDWETSVFLLAHLGREAAPSLGDALRDTRRMVRLGAAKALRDMAFRAQDSVPQLANALSDEDAEVREMAARALEYADPVGEGVKAAVAALGVALRDRNWEVRFSSACALRNIAERRGAEAAEAVPALVEALNDEDNIVSGEAAEALGHIGPAARAAVPALMALLNRDERASNLDAGKSLWRITGQTDIAITHMIKVLRNESHWVRSAAASALAEMGPEAVAAIPALREALRDESEDVRRAAADALRKIDPDLSE